MIKIFQGETKYIEFEVVDTLGAPMNLNQADALFTITKDEISTVKTPTVAGNIITITFTPAQSLLMRGAYDMELSLRDLNNDVDLVYQDVLFVEKSYVKIFEA